jgi:hypothetical protein
MTGLLTEDNQDISLDEYETCNFARGFAIAAVLSLVFWIAVALCVRQILN